MKILEAQEFNATTDINGTNCLAFALGQTKSNGPYELQYKDPDGVTIPIYRAFLWKCQDLGIKVKKLSKLEEAEGKIAFLVYGWYPVADFHIVRKNADGSFEHKPDWKEPACDTSLDEISKEYPEGYKEVFVLDE